MEKLLLALNAFTLFNCLVMALRLISFKKNGKRYKPVFSFLAWLVINAIFYCCALITTSPLTSVFSASLAALLALALNLYTLRHGGNLATMLFVMTTRKGTQKNVHQTLRN